MVKSKPPPEIEHNYLPLVYRNNKVCEATCGRWKPMRAHHCRQCGECSLRMDHHCPWTVNCVGAKNHKAFYLFCIYMGVSNYSSWKKFKFSKNSSDLHIIHIDQYIFLSMNPIKEHLGIIAVYSISIGFLLCWSCSRWPSCWFP